MSVKILHRSDSLFPMKITCSTCNSVLEVEGPRDLRVETVGDARLDDCPRVVSVSCPACGEKWVYVDKDILNQVLVEHDKEGWR